MLSFLHLTNCDFLWEMMTTRDSHLPDLHLYTPNLDIHIVLSAFL